MKAFLFGVVLMPMASSALAVEQAVALKDAPGRAMVESNCGACHSLDYIPMNSPYPTAQLWQAEVTKMVNAFGAPINQTDAAAIIEYLSKNYSR